MTDIAIIGAGPAGLSAAVNAAARNKKCIVFGRKKETSALYRAKKVNNHLGMPDMTGAEMMYKFYEHAKALGVEIREQRVVQILPMGDFFMINLGQEFFEAKTVIIATGAPKTTKIPGEAEYLGKGVSYCATCDGMLYRDKKVVIQSETDEGDMDADFLSEICSEVHYFPLYGIPEKISGKVILHTGSIKSVNGEEYACGVTTDGGEMDCEGIFLIKAVTPVESLVYGLEMSGDGIKVNSNMETNVPGVFAGGDCTGWPLQLSCAIGEGLITAQQASRYLAKK